MLLRGHRKAGPAAATQHSQGIAGRHARPSSATHCSAPGNGNATSSNINSSSSSSSSVKPQAAGPTVLQPATAYQLPPSFWNERQALYQTMRHERDRSDRRKRLQQLKAVEEAQLVGLPAAARSAYEAEATALRIAAAEQQQAALAHALQHGLKVVIDCSYCLHEDAIGSSSSSSSSSACSHSSVVNSAQSRQGLQQQQGQIQPAVGQEAAVSVAAASAALTAAEAAVNPAAATGLNSRHSSSVDNSTRSSCSGKFSSNHSSSANSKHTCTAWQRAAADSSHEVRSLVKQIELCASFNRRSSQPVALTVTSCTGHLETFALHMGAHSWAINKHAEHVLQLLPQEHLVVLSPDADEPLLELKPDKAYVVGGIVDRSVCKGLTAGFGARHGVQTVRLPVAEYAEQLGLGFAGASTRPVLNVSDVVVSLVEFNRTGNWVYALQQALPARRKRRGPEALQQQDKQVLQQAAAVTL